LVLPLHFWEEYTSLAGCAANLNAAIHVTYAKHPAPLALSSEAEKSTWPSAFSVLIAKWIILTTTNVRLWYNEENASSPSNSDHCLAQLPFDTFGLTGPVFAEATQIKCPAQNDSM
jgi:hypothetical protein